MELTGSLQEYLKTMYILKNTEDEIRVTDVARRIGCSKPSVNKALKNLNELNLIEYERYGDIKFTTEGEETAKDIIRKYSLLKLFLTEVLEIEKDIAEEEAKSMKHAISEETSEKLEKYINKILNLEDLDCNYDVTNKRCRCCEKVTSKYQFKDNE